MGPEGWDRLVRVKRDITSPASRFRHQEPTCSMGGPGRRPRGRMKNSGREQPSGGVESRLIPGVRERISQSQDDKQNEQKVRR